MKALVLAAGKGTRLKPLTNTVPKHLLPAGDKPILFHVLDQIVEAGITHIGIVVSPDSDLYIRQAIDEAGQRGAEITFIPQFEPLGLAHAVKVAQDFLGDAPFLMFLGDNLIQDGVKGFVEDFRASAPDASIFLKEVADPRAFGVAEVDASGRVVRVVEKPLEPKSNLAIIGIYLFTPEIHRAIAQIRPSWRGELEITDAIQRLMEMGKEVKSRLMRGWWLDIGSAEGLIDANRAVLAASLKRQIRGEVDSQSRVVGKVQIGEGTRLENSSLHGPVHIGADCRIANSVIGPFATIGARTVIENSRLKHSVILEDCHITGVGALADSVVGRNSVVIGKRNSRAKVSLTVGDDCRVELK